MFTEIVRNSHNVLDARDLLVEIFNEKRARYAYRMAREQDTKSSATKARIAREDAEAALKKLEAIIRTASETASTARRNYNRLTDLPNYDREQAQQFLDAERIAV